MNPRLLGVCPKIEIPLISILSLRSPTPLPAIQVVPFLPLRMPAPVHGRWAPRHPKQHSLRQSPSCRGCRRLQRACARGLSLLVRGGYPPYPASSVSALRCPWWHPHRLVRRGRQCLGGLQCGSSDAWSLVVQ